jgi:hypothetical protein
MGPVGVVGRGMTYGASGAVRIPVRIGKHDALGTWSVGDASRAPAAPSVIRWGVVRWEVAFAEGACGALPHRERDSGWDIVTGPTLFLAQRLTPLERQCDTQRETPRSLDVANAREFVTIVS